MDTELSKDFDNIITTPTWPPKATFNCRSTTQSVRPGPRGSSISASTGDDVPLLDEVSHHAAHVASIPAGGTPYDFIITDKHGKSCKRLALEVGDDHSLITASLVQDLGADSQPVPPSVAMKSLSTLTGTPFESFAFIEAEGSKTTITQGKMLRIGILEHGHHPPGIDIYIGGKVQRLFGKITMLRRAGPQEVNGPGNCSTDPEHDEVARNSTREVLDTSILTFERDDVLDWIDQDVDSSTNRSDGPKSGVSVKSESLSRLSRFSAQDSEDHASDLDNDDTRTPHLSSRSFEEGRSSDCADLNTDIAIKSKEVNEDVFSDPAPRGRIEAKEPELCPDLEHALLGLAGGNEPLMCLISEIRHARPVTMNMFTRCKITWTDKVKLGLEELTKRRWTWWPFTPPKQPLKNDECQLEWACSCGDIRWENVPFDFGQKLAEFVRQGSPSTKASNTHANTGASTQSHNSGGKPSNFGSSNTPSLSSGGASALNAIGVQNNIANTGSVQPQSADTREKHIFLVASCGSLQLHQIISTAQCTMSFSEGLRRGYRQLRGFWRCWFSIYKFSHCDFFEFEKFCSSTFSDIGPGLPPEEYPYTEDYFYKPRPARSKTPISPKEFQHIYYHYRKTSAVRINTWYQPFTVMAQAPFYWPRFFRQPPPLLQQQIDGNLPTDTVPKIPQRLTHFDELSNNRETFWGLHAREQISAFMVSIYTLLALMPWLAFCFVYIFGLGNKEVDIQNATTPLTISLTTVSLFIAWLVKH